MAWIDHVTKDLEEELRDAIKYANMAKEAHDGDRQVLHDMAREEYTHAKHLCRMLKAHGVETDHHELWEQAKAALW